MAKVNADGNKADQRVTNKNAGTKAARKRRGEGEEVSVCLPSNVWKVLHAISRIQGTRISALLAHSLGSIMEHEGVSLEAVQRFLSGTQELQVPKEIRSEVLEKLFGFSANSTRLGQ